MDSSITPYVPVLKTKQGELAALAELAPGVRQQMTPLLELVPPDKRTPSEHLEHVHARVTKAFSDGDRFFLGFCDEADALTYLGGPLPTSASTAIERIFSYIRTEGLAAIPVTHLGAKMVFQDKVREIVRKDDLGVCIRIGHDDFDVRTLRARVQDVIEFLEREPWDVDIVVDLGSVAADQVTSMALAAEAVIATLPEVERYRSLTVASAGFPQNLSGCARDSVTRIPRTDWLLYETLRSSTTLKRRPAYGDYGIQHPVLGEFDPQRMRMSASIRYTGETEYVIAKGRMIGGGHGWEQTQTLSGRLVQAPEFRGAAYSAGEDYIAKRATGSNSVGGGTVWRRVGFTQHLSLAVQQYANSAGA